MTRLSGFPLACSRRRMTQPTLFEEFESGEDLVIDRVIAQPGSKREPTGESARWIA